MIGREAVGSSQNSGNKGKGKKKKKGRKVNKPSVPAPSHHDRKVEVLAKDNSSFVIHFTGRDGLHFIVYGADEPPEHDYFSAFPSSQASSSPASPGPQAPSSPASPGPQARSSPASPGPQAPSSPASPGPQARSSPGRHHSLSKIFPGRTVKVTIGEFVPSGGDGDLSDSDPEIF